MAVDDLSETFIIEKLVRWLFHSHGLPLVHDRYKFNWQALTIPEFFNPSWQPQSLSPSSREEVKTNVHIHVTHGNPLVHDR